MTVNTVFAVDAIDEVIEMFDDSFANGAHEDCSFSKFPEKSELNIH